jgi:hypothetical protein
MVLIYILFVFGIVICLFSNKEQFYSDLKISKCRKDFDFFERIREYIYETNDNNYGNFLKGCGEHVTNKSIQKNAFKDEANFKSSSNVASQCNNLANQECTFSLDLPSLNVNCHNDYYNWCIDSYKN